ncbi:DUF1376 domain-containing protein [Geminicoccus harenae]|uniref:DUF1376 domain-containing protein n=1 Tax=Geminicoccus harenae TaxID=2498453 RepID=UPI00168BD6C4|nr:DUF1376 domain-containing protein [Geminicoccus harenae]
MHAPWERPPFLSIRALSIPPQLLPLAIHGAWEPIMADFPAMPFYTDAYLADTTHLTTEEHGAYLLLLFAAWRSPGCCLRDDDAFLARVAKVTPDRWRKRLRPVLAPFWRIQGGSWTQKKQQSVREKLGAISEKRQKAARQAREAKPLAERETAPAHQAANGGHISGYPKPNTKTKESPPTVPLSGDERVLEEFEVWWQAYPRKIGRRATLEAYQRVRAEVEADVLLVAVKAAAAAWKAEGTQDRFIPHPANWLEQRRWQDQAAEVPVAPAEPIELARLSAGALLATQSRARYEALLARVGAERLVGMVETLGEGRDTRDLFLAVERIATTQKQEITHAL